MSIAAATLPMLMPLHAAPFCAMPLHDAYAPALIDAPPPPR
jgi:hypothetical protein